MKKLLALFLLLIFYSSLLFPVTYEKIWDWMLEDYLKPGEINGIQTTILDYEGLRIDPNFEWLLKKITKYPEDRLKTKTQKLAFWINVYNIAAVKIVTDNYPIKNIRKLNTFSNSVWGKPAIIINNQTYTLSKIKYKILRELNEPKFHFAISNTAVSSPDLGSKAYRSYSINNELQKRTRWYLKNPTKGLQINDKKKIIRISPIFKWFKKDFQENGSILAFLKKHTNKDFSDYKIKYLPYHWDLNSRPPKKEI